MLLMATGSEEGRPSNYNLRSDGMLSLQTPNKSRIFRANDGNWLIRPRRGNVIAIFSFAFVCLPLLPSSSFTPELPFTRTVSPTRE